MRNWRWLHLSTAVALAILAAAVSGPRANAAATGPEIKVGPITAQGDQLSVVISSAGSGFTPYTGFSIHLRWDPGVFTMSSATSNGGLFDAASGKAVCVGPQTSTFDSDGGGMLLACALVGGQGISDVGTLITVVLAVNGSACTRLHLTTLGPPDGGDTSSGTYTMNPDADGNVLPQTNQLTDAVIDAKTGGPCASSTSPTPTVQPAVADPSLTAQAATAIANGFTPVPAAGSPVPPGGSPGPESTPQAGNGSPLPLSTAAAATARALGTPVAGSTAGGSAVLSGSTPPSGDVSPAASGDGGGSNTGLIIGIVVAVVVVGGGAAGGFAYLRRRG